MLNCQWYRSCSYYCIIHMHGDLIFLYNPGLCYWKLQTEGRVNAWKNMYTEHCPPHTREYRISGGKILSAPLIKKKKNMKLMLFILFLIQAPEINWIFCQRQKTLFQLTYNVHQYELFINDVMMEMYFRSCIVFNLSALFGHKYAVAITQFKLIAVVSNNIIVTISSNILLHTTWRTMHINRPATLTNEQWLLSFKTSMNEWDEMLEFVL